MIRIGGGSLEKPMKLINALFVLLFISLGASAPDEAYGRVVKGIPSMCNYRIASSPRTSSESGLQTSIARKLAALKPPKLERRHPHMQRHGCRVPTSS